jgi:hypothetical protein
METRTENGMAKGMLLRIARRGAWVCVCVLWDLWGWEEEWEGEGEGEEGERECWFCSSNLYSTVSKATMKRGKGLA